jgi:hypothetical protein
MSRRKSKSNITITETDVTTTLKRTNAHVDPSEASASGRAGPHSPTGAELGQIRGAKRMRMRDIESASSASCSSADEDDSNLSPKHGTGTMFTATDTTHSTLHSKPHILSSSSSSASVPSAVSHKVCIHLCKFHHIETQSNTHIHICTHTHTHSLSHTYTLADVDMF